jgi:hypothetical protein
MKPLVGWLGAAILVFTFAGCGDETDSVTSNAPPPSADGRPAGFADMMKGMEKDMQKATSKKR